MIGCTRGMKTSDLRPRRRLRAVRTDRRAPRDEPRSEFYRLAGQKLADELEGEAELDRDGQRRDRPRRPAHGDAVFLNESQRLMRENAEW